MMQKWGVRGDGGASPGNNARTLLRITVKALEVVQGLILHSKAPLQQGRAWCAIVELLRSRQHMIPRLVSGRMQVVSPGNPGSSTPSIFWCWPANPPPSSPSSACLTILLPILLLPAAPATLHRHQPCGCAQPPRRGADLGLWLHGAAG